MQRDTITVQRFFKEHAEQLELKPQTGELGFKRIIYEPTVNRPGLVLTGFTRYFAYKRIQTIGHAEAYYLKSLPKEERTKRYQALFKFKIPCLVFSRDLEPDSLLLAAAEKACVPVFQTPLITMKFINNATLALETMFAPHGTEMGSMVDILGIGVIIRGESGIGKSESVLALIERGYSLVADDITKVTIEDGDNVIGTSSDLTRNHMEVRGIGIINVAAMFGVKSIRTKKRVDLIITLKAWNEVHDVERVGMEEEHEKILGLDIPHITLPVRPGRDLARLIEVAAFQQKLRMAGVNPARDLNERLLAKMAASVKP
ncbi:MAG: HPr(Ser) kinase/phosphatase [Verrucomicrobiota bacterium]